MKVLALGEMLWDVFPDQELLGGAALNFCTNLQRLGDAAILFSGVGKDRRGELAHEAMTKLDLETDFVQTIDGMPTGVAMVTINSEGEPHFTIQRPAAFDRITLSPEMFVRVAALEIEWLYFGTLLQMESDIERAMHDLVHRLTAVRCFYDMNLRAGHWNFELVKRLSRLASVLKLNESEAQTIAELAGVPRSEFSIETFCREWASEHDIDAVCVTLGPRGCFVYQGGSELRVPGHSITVRDTVGSGDAFAAAFLHGYHRGWPMAQTARLANTLGALVASLAGATPHWSLKDCQALAGLTP
jgi:fructokinase